MVRRMMVWTLAVSSLEGAIQYLSGIGTETTHCRVGTRRLAPSVFSLARGTQFPRRRHRLIERRRGAQKRVWSAYPYTYLRRFDYWLRGIENGVTAMPKVQLFVMGRNEWRGEKGWPVERAELIRYYLHSDGQANTRLGTGRLMLGAPEDEPPDRFVYDPGNPVPTVGGPTCCTGTPDAPAGAFDQSEVEMRSDVLVYTSPTLDEGVEVTGPLELVLFVSSSARDTDFTGKLVDVQPDGRAYNVQEGILRARYRRGYSQKVWMEPDEVYEIRISLHDTSYYFRPGHRIRLEVSSSNFPRFDRNLNTGGRNYDETEWKVARNSVHHSLRYPSHLLLPVVPVR